MEYSLSSHELKPLVSVSYQLRPMHSSRTLVTCDSAMRQNGDQSEELKSLQIMLFE
ncbi:hypothetical protein PP707_05285 [Acetobacter pasteurianus]|nr:hypothetical protein [Acetobacter pasteurianus]